eukprot:COSAG06_NODE_37690_length_432_cov_0.774775_1_plen_36_part_10
MTRLLLAACGSLLPLVHAQLDAYGFEDATVVAGTVC